jgi:putrescine aminotransferase
MELVADPQTTQPAEWFVCEKAAFEIRKAHGVIARPYGHNLVLAPPLVISEEETARATSAVVEVLSRLSADGTLAPRQ